MKTWEERFYIRLAIAESEGKRLSYRNPMKYLALNLFANVNIRTSNGRYKKHRCKRRHAAYLKKNIKQNLTFKELCLLVEHNWYKIRKMQFPELNRIDMEKDYVLENLEIIERAEHIEKDWEARRRRTKTS